jgi:hypothetical protein
MCSRLTLDARVSGASLRMPIVYPLVSSMTHLNLTYVIRISSIFPDMRIFSPLEDPHPPHINTISLGMGTCLYVDAHSLPASSRYSTATTTIHTTHQVGRAFWSWLETFPLTCKMDEMMKASSCKSVAQRLPRCLWHMATS